MSRKLIAIIAAFLSLLVATITDNPSLTSSFHTEAALQSKQSAFPGKEWERIEKPESVGFSSVRLQALRAWVQSLDTTALMVVVGGRSLFEYGDLTHLSYLASVRKSVLAILFGKYVENGAISLNKTLRELEFTDVGGLQPREQEATIEHLLTARSGVYHLASNPGDSTDSAPPRASQRPGTYFLYNNWDFNAAGALFEKLTKRDIYDALETDLARPLGMQDFDRSRQRKSGDPTRSQYMAYHMWLSTRDMARVGLLMLREGRWANQQIVSREWTRRITALVTPMNEMNPPSLRALGTGMRWGYGYLWWVWDAPNSQGEFAGAYTGMGAGGQYITVLPQLDMVIAHKTDLQQISPHGGGERRRNVTLRDYDSILRMLIAARCPGPCQ
ncbi:MAG: serine hydrolase [Acidobacteriota bacterium]